MNDYEKRDYAGTRVSNAAGVNGVGAELLLGVARLQFVCHTLSVKSGWWDGVNVNDPNVVAAKLCLVHSEVSEALEGVRKGEPDKHLPHRSTTEVELADAVIRIADLAGALKLDLAGALIEKLAYNQDRADHKRENRAKEGGKKI